MVLKGLIIRQPWIGLILSGQKIWEMRSRSTSVRGPIALIERGTGTILGVANLSASLPPLRPSEMAAHFEKHRIPQDLIEEVGYNWLTPWVVTDVRCLDRPVSYPHKSGAVIWVDLNSDIQAAVFNSRSRVAATGSLIFGSTARSSENDIKAAQCELSNLDQRHEIKVPANVSSTARSARNKLFIDVEWDNSLPAAKSAIKQWIEVIGIFAALMAMVCTLGFIVHLALGIMSNSISALSAFKWLVPTFVSGFIAAILGKGHLFEDAFPQR